MSARRIHRLDQVVGHRNILAFVDKALKRDRIPDVLILYGSPGVGKSAIAKLLAIETVTMKHPELKDKYTREVIDNDNETDCIKIFNMATIKEKEEEIQRMCSELNVGFSTTGRKVLILDEAHGMTRAAQDAILTQLEFLPPNVHVFICTSEIGILREALVQRAAARLLLSDLSTNEMNILIKNIIRDRHLAFSFNQQIAVSLIAAWAKNRPRNAEQLLSNFEDGETITAEGLSIFLNTNIIPEVIELVKYLYGSMVLGIEFIESMKFTPEFKDALIQVVIVVLGSTSNMVSTDDSNYLRDYFSDKDVNHLLKFVQQVTGLNTVTKAKVVSAFINSHIHYENLKTEPEKLSQSTISNNDLFTLSQYAEPVAVTVANSNEHNVATQTIAELMALGESVQGGF